MYWDLHARTCFRQFVFSFQKFQNYVLFYQEPEPDKKFPEPPQNRPAPKPCLQGNLWQQRQHQRWHSPNRWSGWRPAFPDRTILHAKRTTSIWRRLGLHSTSEQERCRRLPTLHPSIRDSDWTATLWPLGLWRRFMLRLINHCMKPNKIFKSNWILSPKWF